MRTRDGGDYISLKDAGAMSGCSSIELRVLCLEGNVRSKWLSDGSCFVDKASLMRYLSKKNVRASLHNDLYRGVHEWNKRMTQRFKMLVVMATVFVVALIIPLFLLGGTLSPESDATLVASTFNSTTLLREGDGNLFVMTVTGINDSIAGHIEKAMVEIYRIITSIF